MTDRLARAHVLVVTVLAFFIAWAMIAAHPWKESASAPLLPTVDAQLAAYEQQLDRTARLAGILARTRTHRAAATTTPLPPRIVTVPALTVTRSS